MSNRLPNISDKYKICIICEGNEEFRYLERLNQLHVWSDIYDITLVNAEGNGNIPARYQDRYQNGSYELVLIFCDTEKKPYEQYEDIKKKINEFHGISNAADEVIIFGNPCTMQIVSKHWTDEIIKKPSKSYNAPLIEKYTGVKGYKGRADQINQLMIRINVDNYIDMKARVCNMPHDDYVDGSSNFNNMIQRLESTNKLWIDRINDVLEGE